jgi:hypothetical protein
MLLAIDVRERRVVGATVSPGVASVDTLPVVLDLSVDNQRNEKGRGLDGTPAGCTSHHVVRSSAEFLHRVPGQPLVTLSVDRGRIGVRMIG